MKNEEERKEEKNEQKDKRKKKKIKFATKRDDPNVSHASCSGQIQK
jgi:hypothetical protein